MASAPTLRSTSVRGEPQHRGGFGLKGYQITEKTGKAAGGQGGGGGRRHPAHLRRRTIIRMAAADVNLYSRTAQGSQVMRVSEGTRSSPWPGFPRRMKRETQEET